MDKLNAVIIPPIGKNELLVVKEDVWKKVTEHITSQNELINELRKEIVIIRQIYDEQEKRIKILAKALGGVYENEE